MKFIASDLDGTLLNKEGKISAENAQAIKRAQEHGITFTAVTGRTYQSANLPLQEAGITCPIISLNGAISSTEDGQMIREVSMDAAVCKKILDGCRKSDMHTVFFTSKGVYADSREQFLKVIMDIIATANPKATDEQIYEGAKQYLEIEKMQFIGAAEELFHAEDLLIYKILGFSLKEENRLEVYKQLEDVEDMVITSSGEINLEFNHPDAQKGTAVELFAKRLGVGMEDVMAMGDNFNDVSMLQKAGRAVAMGNAMEEVKKVCNHMTKTNNEHGVAVAIEEMLKEAEVI